jgi:hypothetical protein
MAEMSRGETRRGGSGPRRPAPRGRAGKRTGFAWAGLAILGLFCMALALPQTAAAAPVGRFVQVTGKVDLLKQGKEPAQAAKEQAAVETNDVIQTHPGAKAQIKFIDDSSIIISPESRLKIENFVLQEDKNQRNAVFYFFQGIIRFTVNRIYNLKEPDFIIKTDTAILGVRGTDGMSIKSQADVFLFVFQGMVAFGTDRATLARAMVVRSMQGNQCIAGVVAPVATTITTDALPTLGGLLDKGVPPVVPLAPTIQGVLNQFKDITGPPIQPAPPAEMPLPPTSLPPAPVQTVPPTVLGTGTTTSPSQ